MSETEKPLLGDLETVFKNFLRQIGLIKTEEEKTAETVEPETMPETPAEPKPETIETEIVAPFLPVEPETGDTIPIPDDPIQQEQTPPYSPIMTTNFGGHGATGGAGGQAGLITAER